MKAVIVDFRDGHAAALRDDGCVVKVRDAGYELGQVIELHEGVQPRWRRTVFSLAAAAALLLGIGGAAYATPYGTVTLDADSSIQYTINMFDYVLDVKAENEEGEALLAELDIRHIRHRPVDSAITSAMQQLEQRRAPEDAALSPFRRIRETKNTQSGFAGSWNRRSMSICPSPPRKAKTSPACTTALRSRLDRKILRLTPLHFALMTNRYRMYSRKGRGPQVLEAYHWNHRPDSSRMRTERP